MSGYDIRIMPINRIVASLVLVHLSEELAEVRERVAYHEGRCKMCEEKMISAGRKAYKIEHDPHALYDDRIAPAEECDQWTNYLTEATRAWQHYVSILDQVIHIHNLLLEAINDDQAEFEVTRFKV
jgi:hypothetical protein